MPFSLPSVMYENDHLYFIRKPGGIATSRGMQTSFLDIFEHTPGELQTFSLEASMQEYAKEGMKSMKAIGLRRVDDEKSLISNLKKTFSRDEEYGLVNRLDTVTAGFLYFAKTRTVYDEYTVRQKGHRITKHYMALVHGNPLYLITYGKDEYGVSIKRKAKTLTITYPLMHHRYEDDRMIVLKEKYLVPESTKGRGRVLDCETQARVLSYNEKTNQSLMHIGITRGQRHQIRAHFHAIGYPLVGDDLYGHNPDTLPLHLRSVGCEIAPETMPKETS